MAEAQVLWLTRDADDQGTLSDTVDVWTEAPSRKLLPGKGSMWLGPGLTGIEARKEQLTLADARKLSASGTLPETDRESVRLG